MHVAFFVQILRRKTEQQLNHHQVEDDFKPLEIGGFKMGDKLSPGSQAKVLDKLINRKWLI